jgi:signal transduction histidine kinase
MKRKVNIYISSLVFFVGVLLLSIVAFYVNKQLKRVIKAEQQDFKYRVIKTFIDFNTYLYFIEEQIKYAYRDKLIATANCIDKKGIENISDTELKKTSKKYSFKQLSIEDISSLSELNNTTQSCYKRIVFKLDSTYNILLATIYFVPKHSKYAIKATITVDRGNINQNNKLYNTLLTNLKVLVNSHSDIVKSYNLYNLKFPEKSLFDNNQIFMLNQNEFDNLLKNKTLIKEHNGYEQYFTIIDIPLRIVNFPGKLILSVEYDYSLRYNYALNIGYYNLLVLLIIISIISFISPILTDKLFLNKISIINHNLDALRFAKYDNLKAFEGNDELSIILKNIEHVKDSVIKREKQLVGAKADAETADNLKSAFLANMSHEIRTPLNAVVGFAQLLRDTDPSPDDVKRYVDLINTNSSKLLQIISDIIDLSQIESGQMKIINRTVCLEEIFAELHLFAKNKLYDENLVYNNKSINITVDISNIDKNTCIVSDGQRLKQIMEQLIDNAVKFSCSGEIKIGYSLKNDIVELFVKDSGLGIAEHDIKKIFGRFVQVEDYMTREYGGTGLGLAISKELAKLLGGTIEVESKLGEGSIFNVKIPYIAPQC